MKLTGPDAVPPPASSSFDERIGDRLVPVPDPNLNSIPSVRASDRIESIVSCTELMKQAEHCGAFSKPQLNHTGLLNAAFWYTRRCFRSSLNACRSSSVAKYLFDRAQSVIVSTTRPISCLTLRSRSGMPICPRKYFETTMLVACCDQSFGISTSRCSNTISPRSLPIAAARISHSTSSNGSTPASVKNLVNERPGDADARAFARGLSASTNGGAAELPLLSTDCWPAPAACIAARSFMKSPSPTRRTPPRVPPTKLDIGLAVATRSWEVSRGTPFRYGGQICARLGRLSSV